MTEPDTSDGISSYRVYAEQIEQEYGSGLPFVAAISLLRAERELSRSIQASLAKFGFSIRSWTVLTTLAFADGPLALGKMAHRLRVHATTITNAVDQLCQLGFAEREFDATDRRIIYAVITPAGRKRSNEILESLTAIRFGWTGFDDAELDQISNALRAFLD